MAGYRDRNDGVAGGRQLGITGLFATWIRIIAERDADQINETVNRFTYLPIATPCIGKDKNSGIPEFREFRGQYT